MVVNFIFQAHIKEVFSVFAFTSLYNRVVITGDLVFSVLIKFKTRFLGIEHIGDVKSRKLFLGERRKVELLRVDGYLDGIGSQKLGHNFLFNGVKLVGRSPEGHKNFILVEFKAELALKIIVGINVSRHRTDVGIL